MQENLSSLPLAKLREMAKERGVKRITSTRKSELVEILRNLIEQEEKGSDSSSWQQMIPVTDSKEKENPNGEQKVQTEEISERKEVEVSEKRVSESSSSERNRYENRYENRGRNNSRTPAGNTEGSGEGYQKNGRTFRVNRSNMTYDNRYGNVSRNSSDNRNRNDNQSNSDNRSRNDNQNNNDNRISSDNRNNFENSSQNMNNDGCRRAARSEELESLDSGQIANGILEISNEYGFIRSENYLTGDNDVYVSPSQIRRFNLKTGDMIEGAIRISQYNEKYPALLYINKINGENPENAVKRPSFESLTPIFPDSRLMLETAGCNTAMRIMNLFSPIGKGQRGMIVSPPKAGKTTLLKQIANAVKTNHPEVHIIILLIDERPEEVTDIKEYIEGPNVEVIYSTFDELPEHHKRVSEMVLERAKRLVEHGNDVMILLDSITRLTRAYNLTVTASGRTLSGGLDPAALHFPKKFFGAARNMRNGGSLTILATALVDTGSRMDDVVFEEFKGTGNMEIVLDRKLSERRVFPAIDLMKSGTRRDDLLLTQEEQEAMQIIQKTLNSTKQEETTERVINMIKNTNSNAGMVDIIRKMKSIPNVANSGSGQYV